MNDNNEQDDLKQVRNLLITMGILFVFVFLVVWILLLAIDVVPIRESFSILEPKEYFELRDKGIKSVIEGLKVVATIFGGIAILGNLFYAAKRAKALDASAIAANATAKAALENAEAALKNAKAAEDKQITERFTKAVEQLASQEITVRLGGIYALERIANNSEDDHWTIMEVLTAFVRENRSFKEEEEREQLPKIPTDIQAALTVIGRRHWVETENERLYLNNTNIGWADLRGANLKKAILIGASLEGSNLTEKADLEEAYLHEANLKGAYLIAAKMKRAILQKANLQQASLERAELAGADLSEADLQGANLNGADLQGANFIRAKLQGAKLSKANLQGAVLYQAKLERLFLDQANLEETNLSEANLEGAVLYQAHLKGANFSGANLQGASLKEASLQGANLNSAKLEQANLSGAKNLTQEQIEKTYGDSTTLLPESISRPEHWIETR